MSLLFKIDRLSMHSRGKSFKYKLKKTKKKKEL